MDCDILGVVNVEEIRVEDRLDDASDDGDDIEMALGEITVHPVRDVEGSVGTERKQIVRGDGFGLAGPLQHEELGQDSNRLKPNGESPEHLYRDSQ